MEVLMIANPREFAEVLNKRRLSLAMSFGELGLRAGVSRPLLRGIMDGSLTPEWDVMVKLATAVSAQVVLAQSAVPASRPVESKRYDSRFQIHTSNHGWTESTSPTFLPAPSRFDAAVPDFCWALGIYARRILAAWGAGTGGKVSLDWLRERAGVDAA